MSFTTPKNEISFPRNIIQALLVLLMIPVYSALSLAVIKGFTDELELKVTLSFAASMLLTILTVLGINKYFQKSIFWRYHMSDLGLLIYSVIAVVSYQFFIGFPLNRLFNFYLSGQTFDGSNPLDSFVYVFAACLMGPLLEEYLFRGIILKGLLIKYNPKKAILISSIIFCFVHIHPSQLFSAFVLGLFFGIIYYKTNSLSYSIILHFFANLTGLFLGYFQYIFGDTDFASIQSLYGKESIAIILMALVIFVASGFKLLKILSKKPYFSKG